MHTLLHPEASPSITATSRQADSLADLADAVRQITDAGFLTPRIVASATVLIYNNQTLCQEILKSCRGDAAEAALVIICRVC